MKQLTGAAIFVLCVILTVITAHRVREAREVERDFHSGMETYTTAAQEAGSEAISHIAMTGYQGLNTALAEVTHKKHQDEAGLSAAAAGLLAGIFLLRRKAA